VGDDFNSVFRKVIFEKLHVTSENIKELIPFVNAFYAFEYPLFYNHYNCEGIVTIIPSSMVTHQGDPWGRGGIIRFSPF
jgi:hypothetical protein